MSNGLVTLDYAAIAIYLALMAGIGGALGLIVKNVKDFFAGGNNVPWHLGAVSNYMTMMSTFVFVAHAGIAYKRCPRRWRGRRFWRGAGGGRGW
jgi:Na+/proline symporter